MNEMYSVVEVKKGKFKAPVRMTSNTRPSSPTAGDAAFFAASHGGPEAEGKAASSAAGFYHGRPGEDDLDSPKCGQRICEVCGKIFEVLSLAEGAEAHPQAPAPQPTLSVAPGQKHAQAEHPRASSSFNASTSSQSFQQQQSEAAVGPSEAHHGLPAALPQTARSHRNPITSTVSASPLRSTIDSSFNSASVTSTTFGKSSFAARAHVEQARPSSSSPFASHQAQQAVACELNRTEPESQRSEPAARQRNQHHTSNDNAPHPSVNPHSHLAHEPSNGQGNRHGQQPPRPSREQQLPPGTQTASSPSTSNQAPNAFPVPPRYTALRLPGHDRSQSAPTSISSANPYHFMVPPTTAEASATTNGASSPQPSHASPARIGRTLTPVLSAEYGPSPSQPPHAAAIGSLGCHMRTASSASSFYTAMDEWMSPSPSLDLSSSMSRQHTGDRSLHSRHSSVAVTDADEFGHPSVLVQRTLFDDCQSQDGAAPAAAASSSAGAGSTGNFTKHAGSATSDPRGAAVHQPTLPPSAAVNQAPDSLPRSQPRAAGGEAAAPGTTPRGSSAQSQQPDENACSSDLSPLQRRFGRHISIHVPSQPPAPPAQQVGSLIARNPKPRAAGPYSSSVAQPTAGAALQYAAGDSYVSYGNGHTSSISRGSSHVSSSPAAPHHAARLEAMAAVAHAVTQSTGKLTQAEAFEYGGGGGWNSCQPPGMHPVQQAKPPFGGQWSDQDQSDVSAAAVRVPSVGSEGPRRPQPQPPQGPRPVAEGLESPPANGDRSQYIGAFAPQARENRLAEGPPLSGKNAGASEACQTSGIAQNSSTNSLSFMLECSAVTVLERYRSSPVVPPGETFRFSFQDLYFLEFHRAVPPLPGELASPPLSPSESRSASVVARKRSSSISPPARGGGSAPKPWFGNGRAPGFSSSAAAQLPSPQVDVLQGFGAEPPPGFPPAANVTRLPPPPQVDVLQYAEAELASNLELWTVAAACRLMSLDNLLTM